MGQAESRGLLAFSVILALGSTLGWSKPALPERPLQSGAWERDSGKSEEAAAGARAAEASAEGRQGRTGSGNPGQENLKPGREPAKTEAEAEEEAPAQDDKSDCDDCVIVRAEAPEVPDGKTAGSSGMSGSAHLAGTLWGLFMVSRPKRMPRTIIRGVTVP